LEKKSSNFAELGAKRYFSSLQEGYQVEILMDINVLGYGMVIFRPVNWTLKRNRIQSGSTSGTPSTDSAEKQKKKTPFFTLERNM